VGVARGWHVTSPARRAQLSDAVTALLSRRAWWIGWLVALAVSATIHVFGFPGVQDHPPYRIDFDVYRTGGQVVLDGGDIFAILPALAQGDHLPFTYPPIAALIFTLFALVPLGVGSTLTTLASIAGLGYCLVLIARFTWNISVRTALGLTLPLLALGLWIGPVRETLLFGQINILLMVGTLAGLLAGTAPWRPSGRADGDAHPARASLWGPLLVGLVSAVKLTPLVFGLYYLARRDFRGAAAMTAGFAASTGIGFALLPGASVEYWTTTLLSSDRIGAPSFAPNQGFNGLLQRLVGEGPTATAIWIALSIASIAVIGILAWGLSRAGRPADAALAVALVSLFASPVTWGHHWVWIVPFAIVVLRIALPRMTSDAAAPLRASLVLYARILAVGGALIFYATPYWLVPHGDGAEQNWNVLDHIVGNAFVLWALAFLVLLAWWARVPHSADPTGKVSPGND
jgi:alpha-1,2-mannosyltransferase